MRALFFSQIIIAVCAVSAGGADGRFERIVESRNAETEKLRAEYQDGVKKINAKAIDALNILMREKIRNQDYAAAKEIDALIKKFEDGVLFDGDIELAPGAGKAKKTAAAPKAPPPPSGPLPKPGEFSVTPLGPGEGSASKKAAAPAQSLKTTVAQSSSDESYPVGSVRYLGHHYYVFPFKMNYADAVLACKAVGGHIVSADDADEYQFIKERAVKDGKSFWLDLTDEKGDGVRLNYKGEKALFVKWAPGKPDGGKAAPNTVINHGNSGSDMTDAGGSAQAHHVLCEWDE